MPSTLASCRPCRSTPIKDFTPIVHVLDAEGLLVVNPSVKAATVPELIALARSEPGKLSYGSAGVGTTSHLAGELFKSMAKVDIVHVAYKGNVPAITDLLGGQTAMIFATMPTVLPHVRGGKLRALAVLGAARSPALPDVPTVAESLPGFEVSNWIGLFGPAGMSPAIVSRLNAEVRKIMRSAEIQKRLDSEGAKFIPMSPSNSRPFRRPNSRSGRRSSRRPTSRPIDVACAPTRHGPASAAYAEVRMPRSGCRGVPHSA